MITYIIGAVVVLFILYKVLIEDKSRSGNDFSKLIDNEDIRTELSAEVKEIVNDLHEIDKSRTEIKKLEIDLGCISRLGDLLKITDIVYSNADIVGKNIMNENRFHYYCGLHFRSHMADQLCRQKQEDIKPEYTKINTLIKRLNDKNDSLRVSKKEYSQIVSVKNVMKKSLELLNNRSRRLSMQTALIRDKIGRECGKRGYEWWLERKNRAKVEKQSF